MIDLYSPDQIASIHVNCALTYVPPAGYYVVGIERVVGNVPPLSGPLELVPNGERTKEGITPYRVTGAKVFMSVGTHAFAAFMVEPFDAVVELRLRSEEKVRVAKLSELRSPMHSGAVTVLSYWSVEADTDRPSFRERYMPALGLAETMTALHKQDLELSEIGHELMVRYIP